jgi:hypothetical protein
VGGRDEGRERVGARDRNGWIEGGRKGEWEGRERGREREMERKGDGEGSAAMRGHLASIYY